MVFGDESSNAIDVLGRFDIGSFCLCDEQEVSSAAI